MICRQQEFRVARLLLAILIVLYAWSSGVAAVPGWTFYIDNDKFSLRNRDRDYTGSFAISYAAPENSDLPLSLDKMIWFFNGGENDPGTLRTHGVELGVVAFTPANITISAPQPADRPYASLVYVTGKRLRVDVHDNSSLGHSLTIGVLGLAAANDIQQEIHEAVGSTPPAGWNNQISDGGEPTFRYLWEYRQLQGDYAYADGRRLQWATASGFGFGYLTEAVLGLSLRYGHLTDPWWSFHSSPTGFGDRMLSAPGQNGNGAGFYLWAAVSASLRVYNALLEGQFRDSAVTYDSDQLRPVTGHLSVGAGWSFDNRWRLSYYLQTQASEVAIGFADRTFTWGGIVLEVPMD
jgi:hypothetical protein